MVINTRFVCLFTAMIALMLSLIAEEPGVAAAPSSHPEKAMGSGKPVKVFILAGQSNMDGQANVSTIDFLGEDKEHGALLKIFKPDGKSFITRDDVWIANAGVYAKLQTGFGGRKNYDKLGQQHWAGICFWLIHGRGVEGTSVTD